MSKNETINTTIAKIKMRNKKTNKIFIVFFLVGHQSAGKININIINPYGVLAENHSI